MTTLIEVCIDSVESANAAIEGGADRLELCGNLGIGGGTTPSLGLFNQIRRIHKHVPIMVMIRPRVGDFVYTEAEMKVMLEDIKLFKEAGANGVVFGVLSATGDINEAQLSMLLQAAEGMQVCFHRAFDMSNDPFKAFLILIKTPGISRVLTSGHATSVLEGLSTLEALFKMLNEETRRAKISASDALQILPGSGINSATVEAIINTLIPLGLREIHMSGGHWLPGDMLYRKEGMDMGANAMEWHVWRTSKEAVAQVREVVVRCT